MNKVIFRCKQSGNTVSFDDENDIEIIRKDEGYEEIKNGETAEETDSKFYDKKGNADDSSGSKNVKENVEQGNGKKEEMLKKRGRPAKTEYVI